MSNCSGTPSLVGNTATDNGADYSTAYRGYSAPKSSVDIETTLFDLNTLENAWVASAQSNDYEYESFPDIRSHYAWNLVRQLNYEGIIIKLPTSE